MTDLIRLAERVEGLAGPDREVDLEIHLAVWPTSDIADIVKRHPRGLGKEGYAWDIWHNGCVVVEKRTADGQCPYNAGYQLPAYTGSIDSASSLAPRPSIWDVASTGAAWVDVDDDPVLHVARGSTPATGLAAAALRAIEAHRGQG